MGQVCKGQINESGDTRSDQPPSQPISSTGAGGPASTLRFSSRSSRRPIHSTVHSSCRPDVRRAVISPPSALCTYSIPWRGDGGTKCRRLPPAPTHRPSSPDRSPPSPSARRFPLSSDRSRGRTGMPIGGGGSPTSEGLPKVGFAKPAGTRAAKRPKPVGAVGSWSWRWCV